MIELKKYFFIIHRIVRNRGSSTNSSSPTATTTTEDDSRSHSISVSSSPNVYSIHSLLNHSQYEYSAIKQRSSSRTNHHNGMRFLFLSLFFCHCLFRHTISLTVKSFFLY